MQSLIMSLDNQSGTAGYILIDLSDTENWPHSETDHILLYQIIVDANASSGFQGDLLIGFLSGVDGSNGNFHQIAALHGHLNTDVGKLVVDFEPALDLELANWFGPTVADDETWQTDVNLVGPDGQASYPAGDGDLVLKLVSSAGNVDFSITANYATVGG